MWLKNRMILDFEPFTNVLRHFLLLFFQVLRLFYRCQLLVLQDSKYLIIYHYIIEHFDFRFQ